jgi:hypothetical protein
MRAFVVLSTLRLVQAFYVYKNSLSNECRHPAFLCLRRGSQESQRRPGQSSSSTARVGGPAFCPQHGEQNNNNQTELVYCPQKAAFRELSKQLSLV